MKMTHAYSIAAALVAFAAVGCVKKSSGSNTASAASAGAPDAVKLAQTIAGTYTEDMSQQYASNTSEDFNSKLVLTARAGEAGGTFTNPDPSGDRKDLSGTWKLTCSSASQCDIETTGALTNDNISVKLGAKIEIAIDDSNQEYGGVFYK